MMNPQLYADELDDVLSKAGVPRDKRDTPLHELAQHYRLNLAGLMELEQRPHLSPALPQPPIVHRIHLPYCDFSVNAWVYQRNADTILIDSGASADPIISYLDEHQLTPTHYLLTHGHPDHVGGLEQLKAHYALQAYQGSQRLATGGHCREHWSYYFPDDALCFCGDALFAGSMGKPNIALSQSRSSVAQLLTLPAQTILLPGHGPLTTVDRERELNCFSSQ